VLGDADPRRELVVEGLAEDEVHDGDQGCSGEEEGEGVQRREPQPDGRTRAARRHGHPIR
jgi:hypothetical protein